MPENAGKNGGDTATPDASMIGSGGAALEVEGGAGGARIGAAGENGEGGRDVAVDAGVATDAASDAHDEETPPDAGEEGGAAPTSGADAGGSGGTGSTSKDAGIDCSAPDDPVPPSDAGVGTRQDVQAILDLRCIYCHSTATAPMDLVLTDVAAVVGTHSEECVTKLRIQPGNARESYLVDKISGHSQSPCGCFIGQQMPLDDDQLPDQDIRVIRSWINAGAD
jgi:hypothetical protein